MTPSEKRNKERQQRAQWVYGCTIVFFSAITFATIWALRGLIVPILIGGLLAYLFRPVKNALRWSPLPEGMRITCILLFLTTTIIFITHLIGDVFPNETEQLELRVRLQYKLNEKYQQMMGLKQSSSQGNWLHQMVGYDSDPMIDKINHVLALSSEQEKNFLAHISIVQNPNSTKYLKYHQLNRKQPLDGTHQISDGSVSAQRQPASHGTTINSFIEIFSKWIVMPLVFIFLLIDNGQMLHFFIRLVPNRYFELSMTLLEEVDSAVGRYLRGTLLECFAVGICLSIGFLLIGFALKPALIIGMIAGLINAIPFIGPIIGFVIGASYGLIAEDITPLISIISSDNIIFMVGALVAFVHLLDNTIFQPFILGSALNLHPLAVILSIIGGSWLFGFIGMLFAIPCLVVCKVILETLFSELKAYRII